MDDHALSPFVHPAIPIKTVQKKKKQISQEIKLCYLSHQVRNSSFSGNRSISKIFHSQPRVLSSGRNIKRTEGRKCNMIPIEK